MFNKRFFILILTALLIRLIFHYFYKMQKIAQFIMSKKFIPVILTITAICLLINFQSQGKNDHNDNPKEKHSKVLKNVRILLEDGHFSPQKIDDIFSKKVLKKFLEELDNEKNIFLKSDINGFKKYENSIYR